MSEATALRMGRPVANVRVLIISKLFVVPRTVPSPHNKKSQLPQRHGSTGSNSGGHGKGCGRQKKTPKQKAY